VLNLYANDGQRLYQGLTWAGDLAAGSLLLIGGMAYTISLIGVWALIGFAILLLMIPLQVLNATNNSNKQTGDEFKLKHRYEISGEKQSRKRAERLSFVFSQFTSCEVVYMH